MALQAEVFQVQCLKAKYYVSDTYMTHCINLKYSRSLVRFK